MKDILKRQLDKKIYGCINFKTSIHDSAKKIRKIFLKYDKCSYSPAIMPLTVPDLKTFENMVLRYIRTPEEQYPDVFDILIKQYVELALDDYVGKTF